VSERHYRRLFHDSYGISLHRLIQNQRVRMACTLLTQSRLPLAEVALRCGFADQSRLNRQVKLLTGRSPPQLKSGTS